MADLLLKTTEEVSLEIKRRLLTVLQVDGFETNLGATVFMGKRAVDNDEVPCVSIIEGEDHPGEANNREDVKITVDYALVAYVPCDPDNPNTAAHAALRDMKKVIFEDYRMGKTVGSMEYRGRDIGARSDGESLVMAVLHFSVMIVEKLPGPR